MAKKLLESTIIQAVNRNTEIRPIEHRSPLYKSSVFIDDDVDALPVTTWGLGDVGSLLVLYQVTPLNCIKYLDVNLTEGDHITAGACDICIYTMFKNKKYRHLLKLGSATLVGGDVYLPDSDLNFANRTILDLVKSSTETYASDHYTDPYFTIALKLTTKFTLAQGETNIGQMTSQMDHVTGRPSDMCYKRSVLNSVECLDGMDGEGEVVPVVQDGTNYL